MAKTMATGVISKIERVGASAYGNPTYRVHFTDGRSWLSKVDAQVGYTVTNFKVGQTVVLTFEGPSEHRFNGMDKAEEVWT